MTRRRKRAPRRLAVALLRVSTDAERQELGVEAQRASIEAWASREGWTITAWVEEEISGGTELQTQAEQRWTIDRPRLLEAVAMVESTKAHALVVHRVDRLARDPLVVLLIERELRRHKAALVCAEGGGSTSEDPSTKLMRLILAGVGEFERAMIGARIKAALAVKRQRGEMTGRAPYGWRCVPGEIRQGKAVAMLVAHHEERETLARVMVLAQDPKSTVRGIRDALTSEGRLNRRGKPFGLKELHQMIRQVSPEEAA
jgi:DNA invertase Pin-like site-specific DNA recombinase